jgi:cell wall-associated NlpC family hydrolase
MRKQTPPTSRIVQAALVLTMSVVWAPSSAMEAHATGAPATSGKFHGLTDRASELAMQAMALIGIPYKYGGTSPEQGMDCSGLVRYVFKEAWDTNLPRTSEEISQLGQRIEAHDLRPGDLVFYNTLRRAFSHVGIYLGDNRFIHSPSQGGEVRIERMDVNYWKKRFNGARRISDPHIIVPHQSRAFEQPAW